MTLSTVLMFALLQQGAWQVTPQQFTVGDSVVLERQINVSDATVRLRVNPLDRDNAFEPIRAPEVRYQTGGALVRYVIAPFDPREVRIAVPDIDLLYPDGRVETRPGGEVVLTPRSVLPTLEPSDTLPDPRWSQSPIPRATSRLEPALIAVWLVWSGILVWWLMRRRVGPRPEWVAQADRVPAPVTRWVSSGEPRAVAALVMTRLRSRLAALVPEATEAMSAEECMKVIRRDRPDWPLDRVEDVLTTVTRASFAPAVPSDVLVMVEEWNELLADLERADAQQSDEDQAEAEPAEVTG